MNQPPELEHSEIPPQMTVPQAMELAIRLHREHRLEGAESIYRKVLELVPEHPDALHFLGLLKHQRREHDEAIELIRRAIELEPGYADYRMNLANVLLRCGRVEEAREAIDQTLALRPEHADAWNNLGTILRARGQHDEAEAAYRRAVQLDAANANAYNNLGRLFHDRGELKVATNYFCKSITLRPEHPDAHQMLAYAHYMLGEIDQAAEACRRWLAQDPENPEARHHYAACTGENIPERAPDDYVRFTFDRFAADFERQLIDSLHYRAPQLIAQLLGELLPPPARQFAVLDAGCGTGLCGPLLAGWAAQLCGVDLSEGMLAKAAEKGCYDLLLAGELSEFLSDSPGAFELVASADTLCYFGSLGKVLPAAARSLRAGGVLAFTVEQLAPGSAADGFRLMPHGRYAHSRAYVGATLAEAGFELLRLEDAHLRVEGGEPVLGLVAVARRPARAADEPGGPAR